ncbi:hypothetical protein [Natronosalvus rutilus]|uniref:Uncharacterized protein n=1 Tax=Natronosalvus rutilus TaxID=2953753 RepID=A0A9E7STP4_9EURY|nr:hypothetical protein [Natronosalvus rutilus]UTF52750.1 hypothetical protein NGM29_13285 [Natronosalvus rutilus]
MFNLNTNRALSVFMIAMLVFSASLAFTGGALATEPTVETSSDLQDGGTWADFNASSDDNKLIEFNNADAADGALVVWDPETGDTAEEAQSHLELDGDDDEFETVDDTNSIYGFNITADQLETVPMEASENKTVHMTIANQSDWTADNANTTTIEVTIDNTMERSVMYVGDYQIENEVYGLEQTDEDGMFGIEYLADRSTSLDTTRDIDGSNTTIYTYLAEDTAQTHFEDDLGELDDGEWTTSTLTMLDDSAVRNYAELPDDLDSETSTLKYDTSGSTDALVLEPGNDYDGETTMDVKVDTDPSWWEATQAYGFNPLGYDFSIPYLTGFAGSSLFAGGLLVSRRPAY